MSRIWKRFKSRAHSTLSELGQSPPGRRFTQYYERRQTRYVKRPWERPVKIGVAILLLAIGFMLGFLPFLPGSIFGVLGLALLGSQSRIVAQSLDRLELTARNLLAFSRRSK